MRNIFRKFLGHDIQASSRQEESQDPHDIHLASCALLLEMANIDGEFSPEERERILSILHDDFSLSTQEATEIMDAAQKELDGSIDLWHFTNSINQTFSEEEKIHLIETIWRIVYADGRLEAHEDHLVHSLSRLLRLSHSQLIEAKLKVRDSLKIKS
ncbi:MAG: TerB family tellurite resistance protein [Desulfomonilia bacterium]